MYFIWYTRHHFNSTRRFDEHNIGTSFYVSITAFNRVVDTIDRDCVRSGYHYHVVINRAIAQSAEL